MIEKLKEDGYKITVQRLKLIEILEKIGAEHPSLKRIYELIKRDLSTISYSTLYNNLLIFNKAGMIELINVLGETHVETNLKPHVNLIYSDGRIADLEDEEIIKLIEKKVGKVKLVNVYL